tara:strand:- start:102 stop:422 length:321 start_codon:yes stop_codon:yes gene_type:complete
MAKLPKLGHERGQVGEGTDGWMDPSEGAAGGVLRNSQAHNSQAEGLWRAQHQRLMKTDFMKTDWGGVPALVPIAGNHPPRSQNVLRAFELTTARTALLGRCSANER